MAIVVTSTNEQFAGSEAVETDLQAADQTVRNGATFLFQVKIDNTANSAKSYVKLYDTVTGSVTVGSTEPEFILPCAASSTAEYSFFPGVVFGTELCAACVTTAGTSGNTNPSNSVIVRFLFDTADNDV